MLYIFSCELKVSWCLNLFINYYFRDMPDLNDLMQQWSDEKEKKLKTEGFPKPEKHTNLLEYIKIISNIFDIPPMKREIHSGYLIFCLYAGIKQTQLYRSTIAESSHSQIVSNNETDQLIIEVTE